MVTEENIMTHLKIGKLQNITHIVECNNSWLVGFMVFNATFNNISVISWRSVLLVGETGGPGENHRPAASH
jgi:hypothetical protein